MHIVHIVHLLPSNFCQDTNLVRGVGGDSFPSDLINPWCLVGFSCGMNSGKPCDRPQLSRIMWWSCWQEMTTILPSCSCFFGFKLVIAFFAESNNINFISFYLLYQLVCRIILPLNRIFSYHTNTKVNRFLNGPMIVIQYTHVLYETCCHQVQCFHVSPTSISQFL